MEVKMSKKGMIITTVLLSILIMMAAFMVTDYTYLEGEFLTTKK